MWLLPLLGLLPLATFQRAAASFSDYPPVDINELSPLTINWNQVHYLVRESLVEIEGLRKDHEDIYKELQGCYGLEDCLQGAGLLNANVESGQINLGAGSLLGEIQRLQREREKLEGTGTYLEAEMRERQRQLDYRARQQQQQQVIGGHRGRGVHGSHGGFSSSSYNSTSTYSSSSSSGDVVQGPRTPQRGGSRGYQYSYEYQARNDFGGEGQRQGGRSSYDYEREYRYSYEGSDHRENYDRDEGPIPGRG